MPFINGRWFPNQTAPWSEPSEYLGAWKNEAKMSHRASLLSATDWSNSTKRVVMETPPTITTSATSTIAGGVHYRSIEDNGDVRRDLFSLPIGDLINFKNSGVGLKLPVNNSIRYKLANKNPGLPFNAYSTFGCGAEFQFYGDTLEIYEGGGEYYLDIAVDSGSGFEFVTNDVIYNNTTTLAGLHRKIVFSTSELRTIRVFAGLNYMFGGVVTVPTNTLRHSERHESAPKCVIMGDSFGNGSTSWTPFGKTYPSIIEKQLGWSVLPDTISGTGYSKTVDIPSSYDYLENFKDRFTFTAQVLIPDIMIIAGSVNDFGEVDQDIIDNATYIYSTAQELGINCICVLPFTTNSHSDTRNAEVSALLKSVCFTYGVPCIEPLTGSVYTSDGSLLGTASGKWVDGTGDAGAPTGDGNADIFISSDKTHPTEEGSKYLTQCIISGIKRLVTWYY